MVGEILLVATKTLPVGTPPAETGAKLRVGDMKPLDRLIVLPDDADPI